MRINYMENKKSAIRTQAVPTVATVTAAVFWLAYQEQNAWWWIILILLIFIFNYGFYKVKSFNKRNEENQNIG